MATSRISGTNESKWVVSVYVAGVNTFGGVTRDYTSLSTWESDTDNDNVTATASPVLECYADSASYNQSVNMTGATNNSTYFRILRNAANQAFVLNVSSTGASGIVGITELNSGVESNTTGSFTVTGAGNSAGVRPGISINSNGNFVIGLIIHDITNAGAGTADGITFGNGAATVCRTINNVVYACKSVGITLRQSGSYAYNDTVVGCATGYSPSTGNPVLKNCIGDNNTTDFSGTFSGSSRNNASKDTTATAGSGNRISQTFTYVGAGAPYQLASTDAGAKGFGIDLSADATFPFDDDIAGSTRTSWDIGAWLAQSGSSSISVFDAITLTESVTLQHALTQSINVFDSLTITESVTMLQLSFINVFEAITITESVTVTIISGNNLAISVFDSIILTESVTFTGQLGNISVFETITLTESVTLTGQLGGINLFEAITITESVTRFNQLGNISIFEAMTLTESLTLIIQLAISISDSIILTESTTLSLGLGSISVFDSIIITELVIMGAPVVIVNINVFDTIILNESVTMESFRFSASSMRPIGKNESLDSTQSQSIGNGIPIGQAK